jgi:NADPH-dependent glutamate synthase beta subunit-like oxidoreductase
VEIRLNTLVGKDSVSLESLRVQGYKAIIIATGAHKSVNLGIEGEALEGVHQGIAFLTGVNSGYPAAIGEKVVVVGGGNVAVDAARCAYRLGAKEVIVVYRRSREEMPAYPEEIEAAEAEGIKILYLAAPTEVIGKDGDVTGLRCIRTKLGEPDQSGRKRPVPVEGSEFEVAADTVITAVGEVPDLFALWGEKFATSKKGTLLAHDVSQVTNVAGVFACGDVVSGPATVIEAIASGQRAARGVERFLMGQPLDDEESPARTIAIEDIEIERFRKRERRKTAILDVSERAGNFKEVDLGFTELSALAEADRCFQCGLFPNKKKNDGPPHS